MQFSTPLIESVSERVQEILEQFSPRIDEDTDLLQSGVLDSLNLMKLLTAIETQFGLRISLEEADLASFRSIDSIAELICQRQPAEPPKGSDVPTVAAVAVAPAAEDGALIGELQLIFRDEFASIVTDPDQDLFQSGVLDSMALVQLILRVESRFGISLPLQSVELSSFGSIRTIANLVENLRTRAVEAHG